jgi:hypothetical protein
MAQRIARQERANAAQSVQDSLMALELSRRQNW